MPHTEILYYQHPPVGRFTAHVITCQEMPQGWAVCLDQTGFYPEGGGQPSDRGLLGGIPLLNVQKRGGDILHFLPDPLPPGELVECFVDLEYRMEMCQQHSGEHILSGMLHALYGAENVGFHIGKDYLTMDTSVPLSPQNIARAELMANQIVWQNVPVQENWYTHQQLQSISYRSKKELEGSVRIVNIPGADCCACCGTHVEYTGQIGIIKVVEWQKYKAGVRLFVMCGNRALAHFERMCRENASIRSRLSAKPGFLLQAVNQQCAELEAARFRLVQAENRLFERIAQQVTPGQPIFVLEPDLSPDALRRLCSALSQRTSGLCAAFSPSGQPGTLFYAMACAAPQADLVPLCRSLNQRFGGRGGGKPGFVQGSLTGDFAAVKAFLCQTHSNQQGEP